MKDAILGIIEEQSDISSLLIDLDSAKTDDEIMKIARIIIVKRQEFKWLQAKIEDYYKSNG